jgi:hypothetical protein
MQTKIEVVRTFACAPLNRRWTVSGGQHAELRGGELAC